MERYDSRLAGKVVTEWWMKYEDDLFDYVDI